MRLFWRSVDLTGNQTLHRHSGCPMQFWRSVDLTGNQTETFAKAAQNLFWRSVDLTGNQTVTRMYLSSIGFGAVSI